MHSNHVLFEPVEIVFEFECFVLVKFEKIFHFSSLVNFHHHDMSSKMVEHVVRCACCKSNDGPFQSLEPSFIGSLNHLVLEGLFDAEIVFIVFPSNFVGGFVLGSLDVSCLVGDM